MDGSGAMNSGESKGRPDGVDLFELLGPANLSIPLRFDGIEVTWNLWLCNICAASLNQLSQKTLQRLADGELSEKEFADAAQALESTVREGNACCAMRDGRSGEFYRLDRCARHR
jgi:hypothetical protein